jgi:hypothetical protein
MENLLLEESVFNNDDEHEEIKEHCPVECKIEMDLTRSSIKQSSPTANYESDDMYYSDIEDEEYEEDETTKNLDQMDSIKPIINLSNSSNDHEVTKRSGLIDGLIWMGHRTCIPEGTINANYDSDELYYSDIEDEEFEEDQPTKSIETTHSVQADTKKFEEFYEVGQVLAEYTTSTVYIGVRIIDGLQVIIKQVPMQKTWKVYAGKVNTDRFTIFCLF